MLSPLKPTSSARAAPAAMTAARSSPALGIGQRPGEEGQRQRDDLARDLLARDLLARDLGVRVVAGALDHRQLTEPGRPAMIFSQARGDPQSVMY